MKISQSQQKTGVIADQCVPGKKRFTRPPGAGSAYLAMATALIAKKPMLWVLDGPNALRDFYLDLVVLTEGTELVPAILPALEQRPGEHQIRQPGLIGERLDALQRLMQNPQPLITATCIQAILHPVPSRHRLETLSITLRAGDCRNMEKLSEDLLAGGYHFESDVYQPGQAARRGGVLDVWPPAAEWPVRMEFFGDEIESLRLFDPDGQRSFDVVERCSLSVASEPEDDTVYFPEYLQKGHGWALLDAESIREHARLHEDTEHEEGGAEPLSWRSLCSRMRRLGGAEWHFDETAHTPLMAINPVERLPSLQIEGSGLDRIEQLRAEWIDRLCREAAAGADVFVYFSFEAGRNRFIEAYRPSQTEFDRLQLCTGGLSEGFAVPDSSLIVVAESDLYGYPKRVRPRTTRRVTCSRQRVTKRFSAWTDIQPGEYVVHVDHGIGRYLGLYEIENNGQVSEMLTVEYAGGSRLYIALSQAHLLSKYIGAGGRIPELHRLGGGRWKSEKEAARRAIEDLAASLLETQAARDALKGHAFSPDTPWQLEFEAAFPYVETPDQTEAARAIKEDMERERPMDRLLCGDVGYGKTEVAMRAAFKAVMDGKQVAILVPTTILAQQHYETLRERMAAFPVRIEMLSRFRTKSEQEVTVQRLKAGACDIVVGTHRLLQKDVAFKDLGLVIIDEEQRFGVAHKERLKRMRRLVDVLTMTATPIPRTLYLSLTGARDMSTIQTPPRERLPVETVIAEAREDIIRRAILHEIDRGGQVFYLHNRVQTIHSVSAMLQRLVPEARILTGHGQMPERELAGVMRRFTRREADVLLCTTIIESGVDMPNVNTILIDRADRFGLADLYQLRGRVGRYRHQAYAYLLLPRHVRLLASARQRMNALRRYSNLGAGFKLALRDLELRGAGNLLGARQSGHIAAVGFDLYCQLLERTVAALKGQPMAPIVQVDMAMDFIDASPVAADPEHAVVIPYAYIEDENQRFQMYRALSAVTSIADIMALREELADRFGPLPQALNRLLTLAVLRLEAGARSVTRIETREERVWLMQGAEPLKHGVRLPRLNAKNTDEKLEELINIIRGFPLT